MSRVFKEVDLCAQRPLKENDKKVEYMSRVVCALFAKGMPRIKTENFWKLSIGFNFEDQSEVDKVLLGVLVVNFDFPVNNFLAWPLDRQEDFMLDFVSGSVEKAFNERGLDTSFVGPARECVRINNFKNIIEGKAQLSPYENIKARIICEQEMHEARIYMEVGKGKKVERYFLECCSPDEFQIQIYFGRIEWLTLESLELNMIGGRKIVVARVHKRH